MIRGDRVRLRSCDARAPEQPVYCRPCRVQVMSRESEGFSMVGSRFAALSRLLAAGHSRRGLTRLLGLVALATPVAIRLPAKTAAKKKPCPPCKKRKKGKCKANLP